MSERERPASQRSGRLFAAIVLGLILGGAVLLVAVLLVTVFDQRNLYTLGALALLNLALALASVVLSAQRPNGQTKRDWRTAMSIVVAFASLALAVSGWIVIEGEFTTATLG